MKLSEVKKGDVLVAVHPETKQEISIDVVEKYPRKIFVRGRLSNTSADWTQRDLNRTGAKVKR